MQIEYINRKGQRYYLHVGKTKTGKPKYHFAMSAGDSLAEAIPDGFEIYENPNAQVYLRKALPKLISDEELAVVENELGRIARLRQSLVDRKLTVLTVYVVDQPDEMFDELRALAAWKNRADVDDLLIQFRTYSPMLQFVLVDDKKRVFQTLRYCYLGAIDDWIEIGKPGPLPALAKRYIKHLGQDSYYELF